MHPKEVFWIGAKGGLCEEKHYRCMRDSVWLFLWLLVRQTDVNEAGEGVVNYGRPITRKEIQEDTGYHERRLEDWTDLLRRTSYIRTERVRNDGLIFFIRNAKDKSKKKAVGNPVKNGSSGENRANEQSRKNGTPNSTSLPHERDLNPVITGRQTVQSQRNQIDTQIPTTLTPKSLSYSNKDAAATAAAGVSPSIGNVASQKQIPRAYISDEEARERAEKMKRDFAEWRKTHSQESVHANEV